MFRQPHLCFVERIARVAGLHKVRKKGYDVHDIFPEKFCPSFERPSFQHAVKFVRFILIKRRTLFVDALRTVVKRLSK